MFSIRFSLPLFLALLVVVAVNAKDKKNECAPCESVLTAAIGGLSKKEMNNLETTEEAIEKYCSKKDLSQTHKKICYYIEPIKREISQPAKNGVPVDRICKRLKKKSAEVCAVTESVKIEKGVSDYSKMRVRELKKILSDRGVGCENCLEKSEFVARCKETEHMEL
uniref:Mesencephalic astrocyte-derived neurotrophic factor homolog n=1 Tax=Aplanochytrium stocchinoi TaxID=215587 RepID=A0A7S3LHL3_9STRA|mmetsp:Transcript_14929/g.18461  ORF Transcript_14929/g.18461 Transcript_14929/m.18461 type:complete len:166 (+) Transcript_14929:193-690(+)